MTNKVIGAMRQRYKTLAKAKNDRSLIVGDLISTADYHLEGDGGGGEYIVVAGGTGTDDGGKYIDIDNGLQLLLSNSGPVNVRKYGAHGLTNDAPRVAAALTAFKSVRIPANSDVLLESNLEIPTDGCFIIGDGMNSGSRILFSGNNRRIHNTKNNLTMVGLEIDGGKPSVGYETDNNYDYGIRCGEAVATAISGLRVSDVRFKDIGLDGILLDNISNVHIDESCEFDNCRRWGVALILSTHNMDDIYIAGHYDSSNGTGPVGREFPLGATDIEPNDGHPTINVTNVRQDRIYSHKGEVSALDTANDIQDVTMTNVHVEGAFLRITNNNYSLNDCTISGDKGYLRIDTLDSIATELRDISVRFINTGRTETFLSGGEGRRNLFRADYGDSSAFGITPSVSGTGSVSQTSINVDGNDVFATQMSLTTGSGNAVLTQTVDANIDAGDQVFMYLEVDRTDGNTATAPFFEVRLGAAGEVFTTKKLLKQGVTRMAIAINAPQNIVTPSVSFGPTATINVDVDVIVRKCFLFVNPEFIDEPSLVVKPFSKSGTYTGTATGFTVNPSGDVSYTRENNIVTLTIPSGVFTGTSNSTSFTITGGPVEMRPSSSRVGFGRGVNNGSGLSSPIAIEVGTNGTMTLNSTSAGGAWAASGTKAISNTTITYNIQ